MSLRVQCPCGTMLSIDQHHVGCDIHCPTCNTRLSVGNPSQTAQPQLASLNTPQPGAEPSNQAQDWNQKPTNPNSTLIIGGVIAVCAVALVVVALAGMYFLRSSNRANPVAQTPRENLNQMEQQPRGFSNETVRENPYASIPKQVRIAPATTLPNRTAQNRSHRSNSNQESSSLGQMSLADLIEIVEPTVVRLDISSLGSKSIGSGVVVDESGTIVTNFHVVQGANQIQVTNSSGQKTYAKGYLFADPLKDLAVIKIDSNAWQLESIPLADFVPRKGEAVAAFGSPLGFSFSATEGVVSSIRNGSEIKDALRSLAGEDIYARLGYSTSTDWIQMTAAISGGNSGGPLVNTSGELIGINTWTVPVGQNLNFASTVDEVRSVVEVAQNSELKSFSRLPKNQIIVVYGPPSSSGRSGRRPGSSGGSRRLIPGLPPGFPGSGIPGRSRIPGLGEIPGFPTPPSIGSGRTSPGSSRTLSPEEAKALRDKIAKDLQDRLDKRAGLETVVAANPKRSFESCDEDNVSRWFDTGESMTVNLAQSDDGTYLAATTAAGSVFVFKGGDLLYEITSKHRLIRRTAFSSNPVRLYTFRDLGTSHSVGIRDPETGSLSGKGLEYIGSGQANVAAVSSDGRSIFGGWSSSSRVRFWRLSALDDTSKHWSLNRSFGLFSTRIPQCSVFSPDDRMLITGFSDGWVSSTTGSGSQMRNVNSKELHRGTVRDIAISTDGKKIATGGEDGQLIVTRWTQKSWGRQRFGEPVAEIFGVAYSDDDKFVAASQANNRIEIYSTESKQLRTSIETTSICTDIEFFGNDRFIIAGCKDGKIRIFNLSR